MDLSAFHDVHVVASLLKMYVFIFFSFLFFFDFVFHEYIFYFVVI